MSDFQAHHTCALCTATPAHRQAQGQCVRQPLPWASPQKSPTAPGNSSHPGSGEGRGDFPGQVPVWAVSQPSHCPGTGLGSGVSRAQDFLPRHVGSRQPLSRVRSLRKGAWRKTKQQKRAQFLQFPNCQQFPSGRAVPESGDILEQGPVTPLSQQCHQGMFPQQNHEMPTKTTTGILCANRNSLKAPQEHLKPQFQQPQGRGFRNLEATSPQPTFPLQFLSYNSAFNE